MLGVEREEEGQGGGEGDITFRVRPELISYLTLLSVYFQTLVTSSAITKHHPTWQTRALNTSVTLNSPIRCSRQHTSSSV